MGFNCEPDSNESYLGKDILEWCKEVKEDYDVVEKFYNKYFDNKLEDTKHPNLNVYYYIKTMDGDLYLNRDRERSPRTSPLLRNPLLDACVNNMSVRGKYIIEQVEREMTLEPSDTIKEFYHDVICSIKYAPKPEVYYYFKYNTSGHYYVKRDTVKSPRLE